MLRKRGCAAGILIHLEWRLVVAEDYGNFFMLWIDD